MQLEGRRDILCGTGLQTLGQAEGSVKILLFTITDIKCCPLMYSRLESMKKGFSQPGSATRHEIAGP